MAQSKATKKFERNHLKDTLKRRKDFAKVKQRHKVKDKRKAKGAEQTVQHGEEQKSDNAAAVKPKQKSSFTDMDLDDFFQGGFDIAEDKSQTGQNGKKRKRTTTADVVAKAEASDSSSDDAEGLPLSVGEDDAASDSEDDFEAHKEKLGALADKDPEFYKYLQANDAELLNFEEDADGLPALSDSEAEDDVTTRPKKKRKASDQEEETGPGSGVEVTKSTLDKWRSSMKESHSLRALKELSLAFRTAMRSSDDSERSKYSITDPDAYHKLVILALTEVPAVLQHHLPVVETKAGKFRIQSDSKRFGTLTTFLKTFTTSLITLLNSLSDAATQRLTLSCVTALLPYLLSLRKMLKDVVKSVALVWSESSSDEASRIAAFLVLRRLMEIGDPAIREVILRAVYQGLLKGSRNTTVHTIAGINLMKNSGAELWGLDSTAGYTTGFSFVRQLAIHLRGSITNNSNESYKTVYNWQYVHSLDFWSRVLSMHCDALVEAQKGKPSSLRQLIYPVVQVTLGAMRLIPTAAYFPLRLQLVRSLLRISHRTGTYIPLAAPLYEVLNSAEMRKPPKGSTLKPLDFNTSIRAHKSYLRTRVYQDGVGEQVQELLGEFFVLWTKSIAFPELAFPVIVLLKRWLKEVGPHSKAPNQNSKLSGQITLLVQKLDANSKYITERRAKVDFAPNDRAGVDGFLKDVEWQKTPLGAFAAGQRETREKKARMLEEARKEEQKDRRRPGRNDEDHDDDEAEAAIDGDSDASGPESDAE